MKPASLSPAVIAARRAACLCADRLILRRGGETVALFPGITLLPGALILLRGSNGSGKTTLLRRMAGLTRFGREDGTVRYGLSEDDEDRADVIFYAGHQPALIPHHTVEQHLRYWASFPGGSVEAMEGAVKFWGLEPFLGFGANQLSAGWRQRAALARAMLFTSRLIWLLDEPAATLDPAGRRLLMQAAAGRCYTGGMVVMSVHEDPALLMKESYMPASVICMDDYR